MRYISIAVLCATIAACGGGGAAVVPPGNNPPPGGNPPSAAEIQTAQQVVSDCAPGTLNEFVSFLGILQGLIDSGTATPQLNVLSVDEMAMVVFWDLDTDMNGTPDLTGSFSFDDGQGAPPMVDFSPVVNQGLAGVATVAAALPDDSRFLIDFMIAEVDRNVLASFSVTFVAGAPTVITGLLDEQALTCLLLMTFADLDVATVLTGGTPTTVFDVSITGATGVVDGTATFNGTNAVRFDVTVDGGSAIVALQLDLGTGLVTVIP